VKINPLRTRGFIGRTRNDKNELDHTRFNHFACHGYDLAKVHGCYWVENYKKPCYSKGEMLINYQGKMLSLSIGDFGYFSSVFGLP
jgi:hypothetical protein